MVPEELDHATAAAVMTPHVHMLPSTATFADVVKTMHDEEISAVFIHDATSDNYYIVSKTDIVYFLHHYGLVEKDIGQVPVTRLMIGPVDMIEQDTPLDLVIRYMVEHQYKRVLISRDGKPVGVVSERDVMVWGDKYFKVAQPQVLLFMENQSSIFVGKHTFQENLNKKLDKDLIELYGGALTSISAITDEVLQQPGKMMRLEKDNRTILFESWHEITGILICTGNSIELRRRLHEATEQFYTKHQALFESPNYKYNLKEFDIDQILSFFSKKKTTRKQGQERQ